MISARGITQTDAKEDLNATGDAPIYACRAWVIFDAVANSNLSGSYSRTGTTVTITNISPTHNYKAGDVIFFNASTGTATDERTTVVSAPDSSTLTFTHTASGSTSGICSLDQCYIIGSGNVSSVIRSATGDYTVNFTINMEDDNYAAVTGGGVGNGRDTRIYNGTFATTNSLSAIAAGNCRFFCSTTAGAASDITPITISFFR